MHAYLWHNNKYHKFFMVIEGDFMRQTTLILHNNCLLDQDYIPLLLSLTLSTRLRDNSISLTRGMQVTSQQL